MTTYYLVMDQWNKVICTLNDEGTAKAAARHHGGYVVYIRRRVA